jgi:hypothetical protein
MRRHAGGIQGVKDGVSGGPKLHQTVCYFFSVFFFSGLDFSSFLAASLGADSLADESPSDEDEVAPFLA